MLVYQRVKDNSHGFPVFPFFFITPLFFPGFPMVFPANLSLFPAPKPDPSAAAAAKPGAQRGAAGTALCENGTEP